MGTFEFVTSWSEVWMALGLPNMQLVSELRTVLLGAMPLNLWSG